MTPQQKERYDELTVLAVTNGGYLATDLYQEFKTFFNLMLDEFALANPTVEDVRDIRPVREQLVIRRKNGTTTVTKDSRQV